MKIKLLTIFAVVILASCVSVPVPTTDQNTLLTGKFLVNWNTTDKMSGANGTYKANIVIYFQNNQTGKIISISTQKGGWLISNELVGGSYTIQKLYIENGNYQMTLNGPISITLTEECVNNMGVIQIDIGNNNNSHRVIYSHRVIDYDVVLFDFQNKFPDSEWNSYEWINNFGFNKEGRGGNP